MDIRPLSNGESRWTYWHEIQWLDFFRKGYGWYTLTLIEAEIENEVALGNWNWSFGFLGFRAGGSYTYNLTVMKEMNNQVDEWLKKNGLEDDDTKQ